MSVDKTREILERIASGDRTALAAIRAIRRDMKLYERLTKLQEEYNNSLATSEELIQTVDWELSLVPDPPLLPAVKKVRRQMVSNYDNGHEVTIVSLEELMELEEEYGNVGEDSEAFRAAVARDLRRHL